ncbi:MAG: 50S ribosomal protein L21 [Candidatus Dormibacteraeota bacterium]|nr:50S ribosomal protein L21 [Candidatus Dormibacteraeota bacterium]
MIDYTVAPGGAISMFAIVAASGKQFKVSEGDRILVDRVPEEVGSSVRLDSVLLLGGDVKPVVGTPLVEGALVDATVVAHRSGEKLIVFKFEARKRHRRKIGHRQQLSELQIGAIHAPGHSREAGGKGRSTTAAAKPKKAVEPQAGA